MDNWIIIISFTFPHEAHFAKLKLESEGIEVMIKDELTAQVNNFYSNAIGGVKLLVKESDYKNAWQILLDSGYAEEHKTKTNKVFQKIDQVTSKIPWIGKFFFEKRLLILTVVLIILIIAPFIILSLPSTEEKLTANSWCVDKIYYRGKELTPYSTGFKMTSPYDNCDETMDFRKNGIVDFPGINTFGVGALWKLKDDSLIITQWLYENNIYRAKEDSFRSIYMGKYKLEIGNGIITMQSKDVTIIGKKYVFNF